MKCLVVDDSTVTRRILVHSLHLIGFDEVVEAADGRQALGLCDASVQIVLTDWNMPGMGGLEFVRELRATPAGAAVPVLLISSRTMREDIAEATEAGIDGYVSKPFTPETLRNKIAEVLRARAAAGTGPAEGAKQGERKSGGTKG